MTARRPIMPHYGTNQVLAAAAGAQIANLTVADEQVNIVNTGANIAYVRTYSSLATTAPVATTADYPVPANLATVITKGVDHDRISYISAAGSTLQVMTGEGW